MTTETKRSRDLIRVQSIDTDDLTPVVLFSPVAGRWRLACSEPQEYWTEPNRTQRLRDPQTGKVQHAQYAVPGLRAIIQEEIKKLMAETNKPAEPKRRGRPPKVKPEGNE